VTNQEPAELSDEFRSWLWDFEFYSFRTSYAKDWGVDQDAWWPSYPDRSDGFLEEILEAVSIPNGWSASVAKAERHLLFTGPGGSAFISLAFAQSAGKPKCLIHFYSAPLSESNVRASYQAPKESGAVSEVVTIVEDVFRDPK
jgi:hypothetical protein